MPTTDTPNAYELAYIAGTPSPDSLDSPGANFLHAVYVSAVEARTDAPEDDPSDAAHEVADSAVPIYTHDRWQTFTDLCAYQEDLSEYGPLPDDLTDAAALALYAIAYRLAYAVLTDDAA